MMERTRSFFCRDESYKLREVGEILIDFTDSRHFKEFVMRAQLNSLGEETKAKSTSLPRSFKP